MSEGGSTAEAVSSDQTGDIWAEVRELMHRVVQLEAKLADRPTPTKSVKAFAERARIGRAAARVGWTVAKWEAHCARRGIEPTKIPAEMKKKLNLKGPTSAAQERPLGTGPASGKKKPKKKPRGAKSKRTPKKKPRGAKSKKRQASFPGMK